MTALARLRALADAATPGSWGARPMSYDGNVDGGDDDWILHNDVGLLATDLDKPDAAYLAALDPATVTALLDVAEAAEAHQQALKAAFRHHDEATTLHVCMPGCLTAKALHDRADAAMVTLAAALRRLDAAGGG